MKLATSLVGTALFLVLATANSGGYRYGVSDQAYYAAAVLKARTPSLFPRDTPVLAAESSLMVSDKILAGLSRALDLDLPALFLATQVVILLVLLAAGIAFCRAPPPQPALKTLKALLVLLRVHSPLRLLVVTQFGENESLSWRDLRQQPLRRTCQ